MSIISGICYALAYEFVYFANETTLIGLPRLEGFFSDGLLHPERLCTCYLVSTDETVDTCDGHGHSNVAFQYFHWPRSTIIILLLSPPYLHWPMTFSNWDSYQNPISMQSKTMIRVNYSPRKKTNNILPTANDVIRNQYMISNRGVAACVRMINVWLFFFSLLYLSLVFIAKHFVRSAFGVGFTVYLYSCK